MWLFTKLKNFFKSRHQKEEEEFLTYIYSKSKDIERITGGLGIKVRKKGSGGYQVVENYTGEFATGQTKKEALDNFLNDYDISRTFSYDLGEISEKSEEKC